MKQYLGNLNSTTLSKQNRTAAVLVGSLGLVVACVSQADAQSAKPTTDLNVASAHEVIAAALAEAQKGPPSSVFVVDDSGAVVAAERMDGIPGERQYRNGQGRDRCCLLAKHGEP